SADVPVPAGALLVAASCAASASVEAGDGASGARHAARPGDGGGRGLRIAPQSRVVAVPCRPPDPRPAAAPFAGLRGGGAGGGRGVVRWRGIRGRRPGHRGAGGGSGRGRVRHADGGGAGRAWRAGPLLRAWGGWVAGGGQRADPAGWRRAGRGAGGRRIVGRVGAVQPAAGRGRVLRADRAARSQARPAVPGDDAAGGGGGGGARGTRVTGGAAWGDGGIPVHPSGAARFVFAPDRRGVAGRGRGAPGAVHPDGAGPAALLRTAGRGVLGARAAPAGPWRWSDRATGSVRC